MRGSQVAGRAPSTPAAKNSAAECVVHTPFSIKRHAKRAKECTMWNGRRTRSARSAVLPLSGAYANLSTHAGVCGGWQCDRRLKAERISDGWLDGYHLLATSDTAVHWKEVRKAGGRAWREARGEQAVHRRAKLCWQQQQQ